MSAVAAPPHAREVPPIKISQSVSSHAPDQRAWAVHLAPDAPAGTPLWFYVLREAELLGDNGQRLGPVGGRIVGETLLGLLQSDPLSYLSVQPSWTPTLGAVPGRFTMADLLQFAVPEQATRS